MRFGPRIPGITAVALAAACGGGDSGSPDGAPTPAADAAPADGSSGSAENWARDIVSTDLTFDVTSLQATAVITLAGDDSGTASFAVGDLMLRSVRAGSVDLDYERDGDRIDVAVPDDGADVVVTVEYDVRSHTAFDGFHATKGYTLTWPYFCGNLFPCDPDPADGATFTLALTGVPDGQMAVYPAAIPADAPAYMVAFAVGDYGYELRGTTTNGTAVGVYYLLPSGRLSALAGTEFLTEYVDFLEQTYGAYVFGNEIAAVSAPWGFGGLGGMEHHPLFHVASSSMSSHEVMAHEAAHGWYGNGVRIACWEDFVMSEGVAEYLTARAIEHAEGIMAADALWAEWRTRLEESVASGDTLAYPDGCNQIDILTDPLWSRIPYEKGAFYLRAVEDRVGRAALDNALADFYAANRGEARHMSDLIAAIEAESGQSVADLTTDWLKSLGLPE